MVTKIAGLVCLGMLFLALWSLSGWLVYLVLTKVEKAGVMAIPMSIFFIVFVVVYSIWVISWLVDNLDF